MELNPTKGGIDPKLETPTPPPPAHIVVRPTPRPPLPVRLFQPICLTSFSC